MRANRDAGRDEKREGRPYKHMEGSRVKKQLKSKEATSVKLKTAATSLTSVLVNKGFKSRSACANYT